jgi:hypothetical protein
MMTDLLARRLLVQIVQCVGGRCISLRVDQESELRLWSHAIAHNVSLLNAGAGAAL